MQMSKLHLRRSVDSLWVPCGWFEAAWRAVEYMTRQWALQKGSVNVSGQTDDPNLEPGLRSLTILYALWAVTCMLPGILDVLPTITKWYAHLCWCLHLYLLLGFASINWLDCGSAEGLTTVLWWKGIKEWRSAADRPWLPFVGLSSNTLRSPRREMEAYSRVWTIGRRPSFRGLPLPFLEVLRLRNVARYLACGVHFHFCRYCMQVLLVFTFVNWCTHSKKNNCSDRK